MFSTSLLSLTLAALALQVSASPIVERANKVTCKSDELYYGPLYLTPRAGQGEDLPDLPVSLLNGRFKVNDYTGNKASVLSTRDDNGNPVTPDIFEFADCDSKYMGYEQGIPHTVSYGVLRPKGSTKHCITASAGTLTGAAPKQAFTDSVCPTNDDLTQLWSYFEFSGGSDIASLLGHTAAQGGEDNHILTVSKAGHGQVQLFSQGEAPEGAIDYLFKIKRSAV